MKNEHFEKWFKDYQDAQMITKDEKYWMQQSFEAGAKMAIDIMAHDAWKEIMYSHAERVTNIRLDTLTGRRGHV